MVIDMGIDILESFDKIFRTSGTRNPNAFLFEADGDAPNGDDSSSSTEEQSEEQAETQSKEQADTPSEEQAELTYPEAYKILHAAFGHEASLDRRKELVKCIQQDGQDASFQVEGYTINVNRTFKPKYQYDPQTKTITINLRALMIPFINRNKKNPKYPVTNDDGINVQAYLSLFNDALNYALDKRLSKIYKDMQKGDERDMSVPGKDEQPKQEEPNSEGDPNKEGQPKQEEPNPEGDLNKEGQPKQEPNPEGEPNKEEQPKQEPKPEEDPNKEEQPKGDNDMEGPEEDHTDHEWFNIIASKFDNEYSHDMQNDVEPGMSDQDVQELGNVYYDDLMPEYDDKVSDEVKKKVYNYIIKRIRKEAGQNPAQQQQQQQGNNQNQNGGDDPDDFKWGTDDGDGDGDGDGDKEPVTEVQPMQQPDDNDNQSKKKPRSLRERTSGLLGWLQHVGEEGGAAKFSGGGVQASQPKQIDFDKESRLNEKREKRELAAQRLANKKLAKQLAELQKRQNNNNNNKNKQH